MSLTQDLSRKLYIQGIAYLNSFLLISRISEVRKCRQRHRCTETHLEWTVLGHGLAQINVLHILLQSIERKDIVALGCSVLFRLISIDQSVPQRESVCAVCGNSIPQQEQPPYPKVQPKPSKTPSIPPQQQVPTHYPD